MAIDDEKTHHAHYWKGVRERAAERLASLCDAPTPQDKHTAVRLMAHALKRGNASEIAEALDAMSEWTHACNELKYKHIDD